MFETKDGFCLSAFFDRYFLVLGLGLVVLGLLISLAGVLSFFWLQKQDLVQAEELLTVCPPAATSSAQLVADISGAVKKPGVYTLDVGSRLSELVAKAGGFTNKADGFYIAKEINLAQVLVDSDKFYIPDEVEDSLGLKSVLATSNDQEESSGVEAGLISINQASQKQLESLTGIGEKRAEAIIAGRPYQSLSELLDKQVITQALFDEVKNAIRL